VQGFIKQLFSYHVPKLSETKSIEIIQEAIGKQQFIFMSLHRTLDGNPIVPVRSKSCKHVEWFDLKLYLDKQAVRNDLSKFKCPICSVYAYVGDLYVDPFFATITESKAFNDLLKAKNSQMEIQIFRDLKWEIIARDANFGLPILTLPLEVIVKITKFLDLKQISRLSSVCKQLHFLLNCSAVWTDLDFSSYGGRVNNNVISKYVERLPYSLNLNMDNSKVTEFSAIADKCKLLQKIDFSYCAITTKELEVIINNCKNSLVKIVLNANWGISDNLMVAINNCNKLQELHLNRCVNFGENPLVKNEQKHVKIVNLSSTNANDSTLYKFATNMPNIEKLLLSSCDLTRASIISLESLKHLKELDVSECHDLQLAVLEIIKEKKLPNLMVLKLTCGVDALAKIESELKQANPKLQITFDNLFRSPPKMQYALSPNFYDRDYPLENNYDVMSYGSFLKED